MQPWQQRQQVAQLSDNEARISALERASTQTPTTAGISGTYTPTLTNVANLSASTTYKAQYMRVGSVVTVSGRVDANSVASSLSQLGISLPIASNFGAIEECGGVASSPGTTQASASISADITSNRAEMQWLPVDLGNLVFGFTFTYRVI